jgi:malonyl-ACP O-methyltransferase BioC
MVMPLPKTLTPQRQRIARAFGRKAAAYDGSAEVQGELTALLAAKLAAFGLSGGRWADLGCGTGIFADTFEKNESCGLIVGVDISFESLVVNKIKRNGFSPTVQADIGRLPFKNATFDGAVTASTLQWFDSVPDALKNSAAILKNGGVLAFSVFVQGSFRELFSIQQRFGIPAPVRCPETAVFVRALENAGFVDVDYETIEKTVHAPTAAIVLKNISAIGSCATAAARLLNRKEIAEFCRAYETAFSKGCGVPLTYRAIVGMCRKRQ